MSTHKFFLENDLEDYHWVGKSSMMTIDTNEFRKRR